MYIQVESSSQCIKKSLGLTLSLQTPHTSASNGNVWHCRRKINRSPQIQTLPTYKYACNIELVVLFYAQKSFTADDALFSIPFVYASFLRFTFHFRFYSTTHSATLRRWKSMRDIWALLPDLLNYCQSTWGRSRVLISIWERMARCHLVDRLNRKIHLARLIRSRRGRKVYFCFLGLIDGKISSEGRAGRSECFGFLAGGFSWFVRGIRPFISRCYLRGRERIELSNNWDKDANLM